MEHTFFLYFGLAVISIPTYLLIAKVLFGNLEKFKDCMSGFESRYSAGRAWKEIKLFYFVGLCAMAVYGEGIVLINFLPGIAKGIHTCAESIILFRI